MLRGVVDLFSGCYPGFLFGGKLGDILPVFHFHDVTEEYLEPYFKYLAVNGYKTVTTDEMDRYIKGSISPGDKSVVLCFDDAWASVNSVVAPLLKKYELKAITYVAPSLIDDKALEGKFSTWAQLKELNDSGLLDVQSHTWSHAKVYCEDVIDDWVTPWYKQSMMSWPAIELGDTVKRIGPEMLGCPFYETRSRMSDGLRYIDDVAVRDKCVKHVQANGGKDYFNKDGWRYELTKIVDSAEGRFESDSEMAAAVRNELTHSKEVLESRLGNKIKQVCMPWGIGGKLAEKLAMDSGYESMVADEMYGKRFVVKGGNPYRIMRLKHQYIRCLPGKGRKSVFS